MIVAADDLRHRPSEPGGRMRDSLFWQIALPEERLNLQCYLFLSGTGSCGWHVAAWGEGDVRHAFETGFTRLPDDADLGEVEADGLTVRQPEPLRSASIALDRPGLGLDLSFTGSHEPFSYHRNRDGLPSWFAVDRFEQTGRFTGSVRIGSRRIAVDTPGHRDHSWGVRDWTAPRRWIWFVAYAPDGTAVQVWDWEAEGGSGVAGYVLRDGVVTPVESVSSTVLRDDAGGPVSLDAVVTDASGARTSVRLDATGTLSLPDDRHGVLVTESACTALIDGRPGAGQWENERRQAADA